jgi:excisionase family DNA binding protein
MPSMKSYTTTVVAQKVGISRATLQQWIKDGRLRAPDIQTRPGEPPVRLWKDSDLARIREVKKAMKEKIGRPKKRK